ncbi:hypothetical protein [Paraflavitalea speifideaquila]|uniref:hypothetical protein n=1 Tax=Paraflavitalea speifideaquila TaxID=3076558 RepID=UPI0028E66F36|nr:hypothetical protein [Paraflavitalea speifideiaquila]
MKKYLTTLTVLAFLLIDQATAFAQEEDTPVPITPRWVSAKGYWVVESNVHNPKQYTIRFYNNDQVMVYKEQVQGITLKLEKRKVKMNLKRVLDAAVLAWEKKPQVKENEGWVVNAIR